MLPSAGKELKGRKVEPMSTVTNTGQIGTDTGLYGSILLS